MFPFSFPANPCPGPEPPRIQLPSYDILYNLTGRNISDYLLKTRDKFYKRRYGGFEFGIRNPLANQNISQLEHITDRWLKVKHNPGTRVSLFEKLDKASRIVP